MNGNRTSITSVPLPILGLLLVGLTCAAESPTATGKVYPLEEISIFDYGGPAKKLLLSGQHAIDCRGTPNDKVNYPTFQSQKPIYGTVIFGMGFFDPRPGLYYYFAIDESAGAGYDRLYFDTNHDSDLTNDPAVGLAKDPPADLPNMPESILFESVRIDLDYGPGEGVFPQTVMPRLMRSGQAADVSFTAPTARKGKIRLGAREVELVLAQAHTIAGRYDLPMTDVFLSGIEEMPPLLGRWRFADGTFYRLSATPAGDEVTVTPYPGPFGILETGTGGRNMALPAIDFGLLSGRDAFLDLSDCPRKDGKLSLPVGDYRPFRMAVRYGQRRVGLAMDTAQLRRQDGSAVFPIAIRPEKPFVLDFPGEPEVVFKNPAVRGHFVRGQTVWIEATLFDVGAAMMISTLEDTTEKKDSVTLPNGRALDMFEFVAPALQIANSSGQTVAEGPMPFGANGTCGYSWRVPQNLELSGDKETFTITVTYDTQELYGTVIGKREMTITRN